MGFNWGGFSSGVAALGEPFLSFLACLILDLDHFGFSTLNVRETYDKTYTYC